MAVFIFRASTLFARFVLFSTNATVKIIIWFIKYLLKMVYKIYKI